MCPSPANGSTASGTASAAGGAASPRAAASAGHQHAASGQQAAAQAAQAVYQASVDTKPPRHTPVATTERSPLSPTPMRCRGFRAVACRRGYG
jgi:hypothetical protein